MAAVYPPQTISHTSNGPRQHPYLQESLLYLSNLPPYVTENDLSPAFATCIPFRPVIDKDTNGNSLGTGTIAFKHFASAEKALATLQSRPIPMTNPPVLLSLSPFPPTTPPTPIPPPMAQPRLVKHLPPHFTDHELYELFRPFGCLASVRVPAGFGPGTGVVEFCFEEEALVAEEAMHCAEVESQNIAVQVYQPRRSGGPYGEFSPNAPAFVPSGAVMPTMFPNISPPRPVPHYPVPQTNSFQHGPGQQVQLAPLSGPGSNSHSGLIDPCNLFIKNLDSDIDSNALFSHFRNFGQIVSARVMRNEVGVSRGFGFVSFQTPDQAAHALRTMNGVLLGSKHVIVRLHEPKQLRQEKLAQRFGGHSTHPRSGSGATSPTLSEGADSFSGWPSPGRAHPGLVTASPPNERVRRSSGSYYNAAMAGTLNLPMQYDDLAALSPVVRKEVLSGELSRRIRDLDDTQVAEDEFDPIIENLVSLSLAEIVEGIHDQKKLTEQVDKAKRNLSESLRVVTPEKTHSNSPAPSHDSRLLDPQALIATASAPEHPSTPLSLSGSLSDPPRTSSPSGSIPASNDKQRLLTEVMKLEPSLANEITNLLMSLSKRERALCLFSADILRQKVAEAKEIVALDTEPSETAVSTVASHPITPMARLTDAASSRSTPDLSSKGPSTAGSPLPVTPAPPGSEGHTLASLARLPASEIIRIASNTSASTGLPLPKSDSMVVKATDEFIDSLSSQTEFQRKQAVGEKLFKFIKSSGGAKNVGKITIQLVDQEDLRSLAHLMNSYPSVLREKVTLVAATLAK